MEEKVIGLFFFFSAKNEDSRGQVQRTVFMREAGARPGQLRDGLVTEGLLS